MAQHRPPIEIMALSNLSRSSDDDFDQSWSEQSFSPMQSPTMSPVGGGDPQQELLLSSNGGVSVKPGRTLPTWTRRLAIGSVLFTVLGMLRGPLQNDLWQAILPIPLICSTPRALLHPRPGTLLAELSNGLLSPLLIPIDAFTHHLAIRPVALGISNLAAFGLIESDLGPLSTSRFLGILWPLVLAFRVMFGFIFSRATGWAAPWLFFSNSVHECASGA